MKSVKLYQIKTAIDALSKCENPPISDAGICSNLFHLLMEIFPGSAHTPSSVVEAIVPAVRAWRKFSGNDRFPVPGLPGHSASYTYYWYSEYMWDRDSSYGRDRLDLLDFLRVYGVSYMGN